MKHGDTKTYGEEKQRSVHFVTPALEEAEWSGSRPGRFIPDDRAPSTYRLEEVVLMVGGLRIIQ